MSPQGLDSERLASIDEFGHRKHIIPTEVRGRFRRHRTWTQAVLILVFLALPWLSVGGHQAILIDVAGREFAIFGLVFFAHDVPLVFFLLAMATLGLAFATAVWGRVWCGWACPQTVFIDGIFRRIEGWVEGSALTRRQALLEPMTPSRFARKALKWILFTAVSSLIAHSFAAYFVGASRLISMMGTSPGENWGYFVLISSITAALVFDFGWFREQFCVIMCPYGRFQSVLMDRTSLAVIYDEKRGEPRRGAVAPGQPTGDCVACGRCVQVCPTGIDIRKGVQMDCIACTACIDACDEIMDKVKKPRGLIRYSNEAGTTWTLRKPRAILYLVLIAASALGLIFVVAGRSELDASLVRANDAVFQKIVGADGSEMLVNHRRLHLKNQTDAPLAVRLEALAGEVSLGIGTSENPVRLGPHEAKTLQLFIQFPPMTSDTLPARLRLLDDATGRELQNLPTLLLGPVHGP